jgi:hypothetical protein
VRSSEERLSLSVLDVTPTLLALLGLPVALDMDGEIAERALILTEPPPSIHSYEPHGEAAAASETAIDETTEEQLRSLGYLE